MLAIVALMTGLALVPDGPAQALSGDCLRALSALPAGSVPLSAEFAVTDCPRHPPAAAFRHDSMQGSSRLLRPITQNEIVPRFPEFGRKLVQPGQVLRLTVLSGAVRVESSVEAMQAAQPGQKLFVRTRTGQVFSARYEDGP